MVASSSSTSSDGHRYDVFLSFRGEDTRKNFTSHLFAALKGDGFNVFHDTMLQRGQLVSSGLLQAIDDSQLSIVVFSKNYADSRWCLDELVKIMDCHNRSSRIVLPVFYDVEPSDVRNPKGVAFANHKKVHSIRWMAALNEAGNLSGLHLQNDSNGDEAHFIDKIVKQVGDIINQPFLHVAYYPFGLESPVEELNYLLSLGTNDVRIVAIWGTGGLGKTRIAKAIFNNVRRFFDGSCFLADVRTTTAGPGGSITLQETLIANVIKNVPKIYSCDQGIEAIKKILRCQKVLIVLDDVDNIEQLKKLAINKSWLKEGSRVIITTRDRYCVSSLDAIFYEPELLDASNSLKLFQWHAFRENCPKKGYEVLSKEVVEYAGGLPLVLETLGSYMGDLGTIEEWQEALVRLRIIPYRDVQEKLKLSFDSLDVREKELFLDIACFMVGMEKDFMFQVLDEKAVNGYYPKFEFKTLYNRCLVKIDWSGRLSMHDMVRDMGREIVRLKSLDPTRRCRLCHPHDVLSVLKDSSGTEAIETIFLEMSSLDEEWVDVKAFAKMSRLRMIHFRNIKLHGTYSSMIVLEKLKWLLWDSFPLECIPSNLDMRNLVALDLQNSRLKQLWVGTKELDKLRFLNVSHSYFLTSTPDFSRVKNLEKLWLCSCTNLVHIHRSIECLHNLVFLDLGDCKSLTRFPLGIFQLKALQDLNFSGCSKLSEVAGFEVSFSNLWQLFSSMLLWKSQPEGPESNFLLPSSLQGQSCLRKLNLNYCNLSYLPTAIGNLLSLEELYLNGNNFSSLPASIKNLHRLSVLKVEDCVELKSIPELPSSLFLVRAEGCLLLEYINVSSQQQNVQKNISISGHMKVMTSIFANMGNTFARTNFSWELGKISYWFQYQGMGPFISFMAPQHTDRGIKGWIVGIYTTVGIPASWFYVIGNVYNKTKKTMHSIFIGLVHAPYVHISYEEFIEHGIVVEGGDEIEILFIGNIEVERCGIRLVYDGDDDLELNEQLVIQYSPGIDLYDDHEGITPLGYVSPVLMAWSKSMLDDLNHLDEDVLVMIIKELAASKGGGGIYVTREYGQVYHIIANAFYTQYVQPCGVRNSALLQRLEKGLV